jgi:uncharacterized surface anchored protein
MIGREGQASLFGTITIKCPADGIDVETFVPPTITAEAILPNSEIYTAYAEAGQSTYQRYLVERDPKINLTATFGSQVQWEPSEETEEGSLRIRKLQSGTLKPLAGAVFEILDPQGKRIFSLATDENGTIDIPLTVMGNYTVTELVPPQYHLLPAVRTQSVTVTPDKVAEVTFVDDPYGTLKVTKRDAANGQPLSGATVQIKNIVTNTTQTATTDSSGNVVFDKLPVGAYEIVEVTSPEGYALDTTVHTVNVVTLGEGETSYTLTNEALPGLRLTKFDRQTMTPVRGVTFEIWRDGELFGVYVTDSLGQIVLHDIPAGTYTAREVATIEPYVLDSTAQWIEVKAGQGYISELVFLNLVKPGIRILKVDSETLTPMAGVRFRVSAIGGSYSSEFVTNTSGIIELTALEPGAYTIAELSTLDTHLIDFGIRTVQLNAGENAQFVFTNSRKPDLQIVKRDTFTGELLANASFTIRRADSATLSTITTDANGEAWLRGLLPGVYEVFEVLPPPGYLPNSTPQLITLFPNHTGTVQFTNAKKPGLTILKIDEMTGLPLAGAEFSVKHKDGSIVWEGLTDERGEIHITDLDADWYTISELAPPFGYLKRDESKDVKFAPGATVQVKFDNRLRPALRIVKLDEVTKVPLSGAKFRVWQTESLTTSEYTTDENGEIVIYNLDEAIYSVEEIISPEHYLFDPQHKDIELEWGKVKTLIYTNLKKPTLTITKYDELTNLPLAGATFRLWKTEGETWSETQVTGSDGRYTWTDLDAGIYSIQEIDEPYGFTKDPARKEILLEGGDNKTLEFFNRPRPTLTILKRDAITGQPIQNVKFNVQRLEGETIGEFLTDSSGKIVLSPATGYLLTEEIYRVTEVVPPNEYLLDINNAKDVKLKWYEPTELIFENTLKPTLIFIKRDGMSGRGIDNATYRVDYEAPTGGVTSLGTYKTKCGLIVLPYVLPGWYSLTEVLPAPGYSLPTNPVQRLHLAPGENSYTYTQTHEDLYVDPRTNPNNGNRGACGDWCGYLCNQLCSNCGGTIFSGITITNGKGEALGTVATNPSNPTIPTLTAGSVTRNSNLTATVQFTSSAAGKYYYSIVNDGANAPTIGTGGVGTNCISGLNTITVYTTSGAKDLYIKIKDASGNVSTALKIDIPAFQQLTTGTEETMPSPMGGVIYINPAFETIKITFGNNY